MPVGSVAEAMRISQPSATETVDRLVRAGLVTRTTCQNDRRVVRTALTPQGRDIVDRPWEARRAVLADALARGTADQQDEIARGLSTLVQLLEAERRTPQRPRWNQSDWQPDNKEHSRMNTLARLLRFVRPYWWGTLVTMVLIFAITILKLGPAWMTKLIIDDAIPKESLTLVGVYLIGMIGVSGGLNVLGAVQLYLEQWVGQRVIFDVRGALYDHLQSQSMSFYDANQTGQLMSRVTNDVSQVQFFLTQGLSRLVTTFITIAANLAVMFWLDWHLTLISLVVVR